MVFFFGIAAVEITQSFLPGGDLNPVKKAVNPLMATLGGVIGPVVIYLTLNHFIGSKELGVSRPRRTSPLPGLWRAWSSEQIILQYPFCCSLQWLMTG
jgi:hypothetical protein